MATVEDHNRTTGDFTKDLEKKLETPQEEESAESSQENGESESDPGGGANEFEEGEDVIHPLQNSWALWYFKNERGKSWTENQMRVVVFKSVEEFWGVMHHIESAANLSIGCDYSVFKDDIEPMWEDKANVNGGRWLIQLDKSQRQFLLNNYWMEILMLLIGEGFGDDSDEICGAVVNIRAKGDRLSVWTAHWQSESAVLRIGKKLKEMLQIRAPLSYQLHSDQQNKTGSLAKSIYTV